MLKWGEEKVDLNAKLVKAKADFALIDGVTVYTDAVNH